MTFTVMWIVWKSWDGRLVFGGCGRRVKLPGRLDFEKMTGSVFFLFLLLFHFYPLVKNECSRCAKNISSNEYFYVRMGVGHCCAGVRQWLLSLRDLEGELCERIVWDSWRLRCPLDHKHPRHECLRFGRKGQNFESREDLVV